jgi:hypothetical protein
MEQCSDTIFCGAKLRGATRSAGSGRMNTAEINDAGSSNIDTRLIHRLFAVPRLPSTQDAIIKNGRKQREKLGEMCLHYSAHFFCRFIPVHGGVCYYH